MVRKESSVVKTISTASNAPNFVILTSPSCRPRLLNSWSSRSQRRRDKSQVKSRSLCKQASYPRPQCQTSCSNCFKRTRNSISCYKIHSSFKILQPKGQGFMKISQRQPSARTITKKLTSQSLSLTDQGQFHQKCKSLRTLRTMQSHSQESSR